MRLYLIAAIVCACLWKRMAGLSQHGRPIKPLLRLCPVCLDLSKLSRIFSNRSPCGYISWQPLFVLVYGSWWQVWNRHGPPIKPLPRRCPSCLDLSKLSRIFSFRPLCGYTSWRPLFVHCCGSWWQVWSRHGSLISHCQGAVQFVWICQNLAESFLLGHHVVIPHSSYSLRMFVEADDRFEVSMDLL